MVAQGIDRAALRRVLEHVDLKREGMELDAEGRDIVRSLHHCIRPGQEQSLAFVADKLAGDPSLQHIFGGMHGKSVARRIERAIQYPRAQDGVMYSLLVRPGRGPTGRHKVVEAKWTEMDKDGVSISNLLG